MRSKQAGRASASHGRVDVSVHDTKQRDDGGLVGRDRVAIAHRSGFDSRMARLPGQLQQDRRRAPSRLGALTAPQPAGEVVHEGSWRMLIAPRGRRRWASCTARTGFQPWKAAVDGLVDRW
jgi:hypothetical protein